MSSIPFSSLQYKADELDSPPIRRLVSVFTDIRRNSLQLVKTSHLLPLNKEWRILERFLARHAVPLRHEKGVRLARRVTQCLKRIFGRPDADVVKMTNNVVDLCCGVGVVEAGGRDGAAASSSSFSSNANKTSSSSSYSNANKTSSSSSSSFKPDNTSTFPSRQTCEHYLASLRRVLDLFIATHSHAVHAYEYFSRLLTVGHLVPAFLCFAASVARVAVITQGLVSIVGGWYDELRPDIHVLKGQNADLSEIYGGEDALPKVAPAIVLKASPDVAPDILDAGIHGSHMKRLHEKERLVTPPEKDLEVDEVGEKRDDIAREPKELVATVVPDVTKHTLALEEEEDVGEVISASEVSNIAMKKAKKRRRVERTENAEDLTIDAEANLTLKKKKKKKRPDGLETKKESVDIQETSIAVVTPKETKPWPEKQKTISVEGFNIGLYDQDDVSKLKKKKKKRKAELTREKSSYQATAVGESEASELDDIDAIFSIKKNSEKKKKKKNLPEKCEDKSPKGDSNSVVLIATNNSTPEGKNPSLKEKAPRPLSNSDEIDDIFGDFL